MTATITYEVACGSSTGLCIIQSDLSRTNNAFGSSIGLNLSPKKTFGGSIGLLPVAQSAFEESIELKSDTALDTQVSRNATFALDALNKVSHNATFGGSIGLKSDALDVSEMSHNASFGGSIKLPDATQGTFGGSIGLENVKACEVKSHVVELAPAYLTFKPYKQKRSRKKRNNRKRYQKRCQYRRKKTC